MIILHILPHLHQLGIHTYIHVLYQVFYYHRSIVKYMNKLQANVHLLIHTNILVSNYQYFHFQFHKRSIIFIQPMSDILILDIPSGSSKLLPITSPFYRTSSLQPFYPFSIPTTDKIIPPINHYSILLYAVPIVDYVTQDTSLTKNIITIECLS